MISALLQRPGKSGSSPVLPFGKSSVSVTISGDEKCDGSKFAVEKGGSKALLSGGSQPSKSSVVRRLFRQEQSMPGREAAKYPTPIRRCLSVGGALTANGSSNSSSVNGNESKSVSSDCSSGNVGASISSTSSGARSTGLADGSSSQASCCSLEDALQSLTQAASTTASVLCSARQQHDEALQRQREQFQLFMETMRVRTSGTAPQSIGNTVTTATQSARPSQSSISICSSCSTPAASHAESVSPYRSPVVQPPTPLPTSVTETYRGVQFSIPLGCRIEDGEEPAEVLVTGPQISVVLEFRDGGRHLVLRSSTCVCTVKRMGGRILVNVLPPLTANTTGRPE